MQKTFRDHHLLLILESYNPEKSAADNCLRDYFRDNRALGSKDRKFISEKIYQLIRFRDLIDALTGDSSWEARLNCINNDSDELAKKIKKLPIHTQLSMPETFFNRLVAHYGIEKATEICTLSNEQAPTTIRVNTIKTSREHLMRLWEAHIAVEATKTAPHGIQIGTRSPLLHCDEYKLGYFEMQDEGSQLLAELVDIKEGMHLLDFCAGSGGKTLAIAPQMRGKGQIYLHDIRKSALENAKKRLARAGVQNAQLIFPDEKSKLSRLKGKMDRVLLDVPCSGSGTFRRNPDMKWRFSDEKLAELIAIQREIFKSTLAYLKPGGSIIYTTCSLLAEENQEQIEFFIKTYGLERAAPDFQTTPTQSGPDGFFGSVLREKLSFA